MSTITQHDDQPAGGSDRPAYDTGGAISREPYRRIEGIRGIFDTLLTDRSTGGGLVWATDDHADMGPGFGARDQILYGLVYSVVDRVFRPRVLKSLDEQRSRSRERAEVFTPAWIVNKQNNLVDEQWIGHGGAFNTEARNFWMPSERVDLGDRTWQSYVTSIRLEVCCGEAPYLTTRYDAADGMGIPVGYRVGLLDRKLRVVSENTDRPESWMKWAKAAVQSIYAYDFQGDNVVLARENLLLAFKESYEDRFSADPGDAVLKEVADILSWNVWQMDGLKGVVPFSCEKMCGLDSEQAPVNSCQACRTGKGRHCGRYCRIMDWERDTAVEFASLMGKEKSAKPGADRKGTTLDRFLGG